jgi:hypothetical protein
MIELKLERDFIGLAPGKVRYLRNLRRNSQLSKIPTS